MPAWWSPEVPQSSNRTRCLARARGALAAGELETAVRHYRGYLRRCPTDVDARRELRRVQRTLAALIDRSDGLPPDLLRRAAEDAVQGIEVEPACPWKAVERLEDLLGLDPDLVSAHRKLAFAAQLAGAPDVAIQALHDALALDPNHAPTLRTLGQLEAGRGRQDAARACFARLLRLRPGDPETRLLAELAGAESPPPQPRIRVRPRQAEGLGELCARLQERFSKAEVRGDPRFERAKQAGWDVVDLDATTIPPRVAELVPAVFATTYRVCPVSFEAGTLAVAMADPRQRTVLDDLEFMLAVEVRGLVDSPAAIERAIARCYPRPAAEEPDPARVPVAFLRPARCPVPPPALLAPVVVSPPPALRAAVIAAARERPLPAPAPLPVAFRRLPSRPEALPRLPLRPACLPGFWERFLAPDPLGSCALLGVWLGIAAYAARHWF